VEELIGSLETFLPDGDKGLCSATGEPFVTLAWTPDGGIIKPECGPAAVFETPELAKELFQYALARYLRENPGTVHWRRRPELVKIIGGKFVYAARLHTHQTDPDGQAQ
jgi:hypothetical protein